MKVTTFPYLVATVGLALLQVSAAPVRIEIISSSSSGSPEELAPLAYIRWGLPAAHAVSIPQDALLEEEEEEAKRVGEWAFDDKHHKGEHHKGGHHKGGHHHHRKGGRRPLGCRLRLKALRWSNWVRHKLGLPPIHPHHRHKPGHGHGHHGHHGHGKPSAQMDGKLMRILPHPDMFQESPPSSAPPVRFYRRPDSFAARLHKALLTLGPWEGRAIAFVIGLGIGSLLRMLYVFAVLTYRAFAVRHAEPLDIEIVYEEVEEFPPPPHYVDEKAEMEVVA